VIRRPLIVLAFAGAAFMAAPADAGPRRTVKVLDNFFQPRTLTVKPKTTIQWQWPTDAASDVHDIKLISAPKGVRRFQSEAGSIGYRYRRTLTKPGRYRFLCTFHEEDGMRMTITVKR
jgi:plastocyanin